MTSVTSQKIEKDDTQEIQYFTKQQIIEDIDYIMDKLSKNHVECIEIIPEEVLQ